MIKLTCEIVPDLVGALEDHFCEWSSSPWVIVANRLTGEGSLDGFFNDETEGVKAWEKLHARFTGLPSKPDVSFVEDQDWKEAYRKHFHPFQIGSFHLVPSWEKKNYSVPSGDKALYLDPGMAFGTGNHETTRLCLRALTQFIEQRKEEVSCLACVDAGCGSGILTLAASLLGFGEARGFDLDPEAVRIAKENAVCNGLAKKVDFAYADLTAGLQSSCADLLLANIETDVLCSHSLTLLTALRPQGTLLLSGVLAKEIEQVQNAFEEDALKLSITMSSSLCIDGEWVSLEFTKDC